MINFGCKFEPNVLFYGMGLKAVVSQDLLGQSHCTKEWPYASTNMQAQGVETEPLVAVAQMSVDASLSVDRLHWGLVHL